MLELFEVRKNYYRSGSFLGRGKAIVAVDSASLSIPRGQTVGLVGESNSGKSNLARCVVKLVQPESGRIRFRGEDLRPLSRAAREPYRKRIQMIFQDPFDSLNPRRRAGDIIADGPVAHGVPRQQARQAAAKLLRLVQLDPGAAERFPHEFSDD